MSEPFQSSPAFFEAKYQCDTDPWKFADSAYEQGRYRAIVKALDSSHYTSGLEPGCSIGFLTVALAPFCRSLLAVDFSSTAIKVARDRCLPFPQVELRCVALEEIRSFRGFDLVVLSEIGYYFTETRWAELASKIAAEIPKGCTLIAAHWTGRSEDHQISGERVHEILLCDTNLRSTLSERHQGFRLERWVRN